MSTVYLTKRNGEIETHHHLNHAELEHYLRMNKDEYLAIEIDEDEECELEGVSSNHSQSLPSSTIHYL